MNEVTGLNLNADMVALTACQSRIGKHVSGEGVMGMGRAFQAAGAKSKGLVSFKGRWVGSEEQKVLQAQNHTYKSIIAVRALLFFCAA